MLLSNKNKQTFNKSYQLSSEFRFDPVREAELAKLAADKSKTRVFQFEETKRYQQINRPHVGQEKRQMIEQKLELDKKAEVQANRRIKNDNLIVRYNRNPFVQNESDMLYKINAQRFQKDFGSKQVKQREWEDSFFVDRGLVDAVGSLTQKNFPKFKNNEAQRWKQVEKQSQAGLKFVNKPIKPKGVVQQKQFEEDKVEDLTFDDIIAIEEESYYAKNQIPINIFQFLKGNHKTFLTNAILDTFYFCHISMMDKITTFRFPLIRDLSKIGRRFAKDHTYKEPSRLDNISSNQISFKVGDVKFIDLLSVASGRFNPEIVYKAANEIQVREDSNSIKSEISMPEIDYKQDLEHKGNCFESDQIERQQINDYLKLQITKDEQKYANKCKRIYKNVESQLNKKAQLTGNTIRDKQLHKEIDNNVNEYFEYLNNMDNRKEESQKLIRMNKMTKNRNEAIKIRTLLNSIVLKNRQEQKMKILLDDNKS